MAPPARRQGDLPAGSAQVLAIYPAILSTTNDLRKIEIEDTKERVERMAG